MIHHCFPSKASALPDTIREQYFEPCDFNELIWIVAPAAIIGREIAMSALREWAASVGEEAHKAVAVSQLGKWKTTTQVRVLQKLAPSKTNPHTSIFS